MNENPVIQEEVLNFGFINQLYGSSLPEEQYVYKYFLDKFRPIKRFDIAERVEFQMLYISLEATMGLNRSYIILKDGLSDRSHVLSLEQKRQGDDHEGYVIFKGPLDILIADTTEVFDGINHFYFRINKKVKSTLFKSWIHSREFWLGKQVVLYSKIGYLKAEVNDLRIR
ncbi:MAG TPA: hypothetical protein VGA67_03660 [Candidatus Dojkabacteria bacterium]|jgi:hypothetical protein